MIEENYWPSSENQQPASILCLQPNMNCMTLKRLWNGVSYALQNVQTRWNANYYMFKKKKKKVLDKKASMLCLSNTQGKTELSVNCRLQARESAGTCQKCTCDSHTVSAVKFSFIYLN